MQIIIVRSMFAFQRASHFTLITQDLSSFFKIMLYQQDKRTYKRIQDKIQLSDMRSNGIPFFISTH